MSAVGRTASIAYVDSALELGDQVALRDGVEPEMGFRVGVQHLVPVHPEPAHRRRELGRPGLRRTPPGGPRRNAASPPMEATITYTSPPAALVLAIVPAHPYASSSACGMTTNNRWVDQKSLMGSPNSPQLHTQYRSRPPRPRPGKGTNRPSRPDELLQRGILRQDAPEGAGRRAPRVVRPHLGRSSNTARLRSPSLKSRSRIDSSGRNPHCGYCCRYVGHCHACRRTSIPDGANAAGSK